MKGEIRNFGQEPGFNNGVHRIQPVGDITIASNGRVISQGSEPFRRSEPVPNTGRARRTSGQRNR